MKDKTMLNFENIWIDGPEEITPEYVEEANTRMERIQERASQVFKDYKECFKKFHYYDIEKTEFCGSYISFSLEHYRMGCSDYADCQISMKYFFMERSERVALMLAEKAAEDQIIIDAQQAALAAALARQEEKMNIIRQLG
jgi:hypothetical protein